MSLDALSEPKCSVCMGKNRSAATLQSLWSWLKVMGWDMCVEGPFRMHLWVVR